MSQNTELEQLRRERDEALKRIAEFDAVCADIKAEVTEQLDFETAVWRMRLQESERNAADLKARLEKAEAEMAKFVGGGGVIVDRSNYEAWTETRMALAREKARASEVEAQAAVMRREIEKMCVAIEKDQMQDQRGFAGRQPYVRVLAKHLDQLEATTAVSAGATLLEAFRAMRKALREIRADDAQDRLEDPCGHAERQPYARIHENVVAECGDALALASKALPEGKEGA